MICYRCEKVGLCPIYRKLYSLSTDFSIKNCKDFDEVSKYKYRHIAEHDELMHLIYDYFLGQVEVDASEEEVVRVIKKALLEL